MDAGQIVVSIVTVALSVGLAQFTIRKREINHAIRNALVKLQGDVRLLAMQYIANACHAERHHTGNTTKEHQEESILVCRDTRIAMIAVEGDILSLELLTGKIDCGLADTLKTLLTACQWFVPTIHGGVVPEREVYRPFNPEVAVAEIEKSIKAAWANHDEELR